MRLQIKYIHRLITTPWKILKTICKFCLYHFLYQQTEKKGFFLFVLFFSPKIWYDFASNHIYIYIRELNLLTDFLSFQKRSWKLIRNERKKKLIQIYTNITYMQHIVCILCSMNNLHTNPIYTTAQLAKLGRQDIQHFDILELLAT